MFLKNKIFVVILSFQKLLIISFLWNLVLKKIIFYYILYLCIWTFFIKWFLWDFTSLRFITTKTWEKIRPTINPKTGKRPPSTFLIWLSGIFSIYIALFGIASQRYESRVDVIENRANSIFAQLSIKQIRTETLSRVASLQNMSCPHKPIILKPVSVFNSLFLEDAIYQDIVDLMKDTLVIWKKTLSGVDLTNANLRGANLQNANLENSILKNANLESAIINGAKFENACLKNVKGLPEWLENGMDLDNNYMYTQNRLIEAIRNGLVNLKMASLLDANLAGLNLKNINFQNSTLKRVSFNAAKLSIVNFQKANLEEVNFKEAVLSSVNFQKSKFIKCNFYCVKFIDTNFEGADLEKAIMYGNDLKGLNLKNTKLKGTELALAELEDADLENANLENANLENANLKNANLKNANLKNANLKNANLENANLENTNLNNVNLDNANLKQNAVEQGQQGRGDGVNP